MVVLKRGRSKALLVDLEKLDQEYLAGKSVKELARKYECSPGTIRSALKREGTYSEEN